MVKSIVPCLVCAALSVCAADHVVTNTPWVGLIPGQTLSPASIASSATLPESAGTPIFWFDCTDTNDWEFSGTEVKRIPSKTGNRSLTTTLDGNWCKGQSVNGPTYNASCEKLGGRPMIDFGAESSRHGMVFDAYACMETGNIASNLLQNIGTVFYVLDASQGGGHFLGGGYGDNGGGHFSSGYLWHRAGDYTAKDPTGSSRYSYWNALIRSPGHETAWKGKSYHDGYIAAPNGLGFKGDWEVLSFVMKDPVGQATGVGINDGRYGPSAAGGKRIAEFIVYDTCLTDAQRLEVEAYLQRKWFGRTPRGVDDRAVVDYVRVWTNGTYNTDGKGVEAAVDVPAAKTLVVGSLHGGHGFGPKLAKTGAGTLELDNALDYHGRLSLVAGKVSVPRKAYPTATGLPDADKIYVHVDASDLSSFELSTVDGVEYVDRWNNLTGRKSYGGVLTLGALSDATRPKLVRNALGPGLHVVDMGNWNTGAYLAFGTNAVTGFVSFGGALNMEGTILCVVAPVQSGGHLLGGGNLARSDTSYFSACLLGDNVQDSVRLRESVLRIDGRQLRPASDGYLTPGWQVVSLQHSLGRGSQYLGRHGTSSGGFKIAELVVYDHLLNEEELVAAENHLQAKWVRKNVAGYARATTDGDLCDLDVVGADGDAELETPVADSTVRVRQLDGAGRLVKSGPGTLAVEAGPLASSHVETLGIKDGTVRIVGVPDVASNCEIARGASFHVDACDADSLTTVTSGGTNFVRAWTDTRGPQYPNAAAQHDLKRCPWVNSTDTCNSHPVLDFGGTGSGRSLHFAKSVDSIRSAFVVVGNLRLGGWFLGSTTATKDGSNGAIFDFHRGGSGVPYTQLLYNNGTQKMVRDGDIRMDGTNVARDVETDFDYHLIEYHTTAGAHASCFASDRAGLGGDRSGGCRIGEVILFERVLTDREKIATRNYLMNKWFGKTGADLADLPGTVVTNVPSFGQIDAGGGALEADFPVALQTKKIEGANALTIGEKVALMAGGVGVTGTVNVAGSLALTAHPAIGSGTAPVSDGLIFHIAADATDSLVFHESTTCVDRWMNLAGDGYARAWTEDGYTTQNILKQNGPGGKPYIYMYGWSWASKPRQTNCFVFCQSDGTPASITNIGSVFWVMSGKDLGGSSLLGGGATPAEANFQRGTSSSGRAGGYAGSTGEDAPFLANSAAANVKAANWYLDATNVNPLVAHPTVGGWSLISMTMQPGELTAARGLAFNGPFFKGNDPGNPEVCGWQELAELLIYDRPLTDVERREVETYLSQKYGFGVYTDCDETKTDVSVAAGGTLDLGGRTHVFRSVTGAGTVRNGVLEPQALIADAANATPLAIGGTLTVSPQVVVELRNLPDPLPKRLWIPIATATTLTAPSLNTAVFAGEAVPPGSTAVLAVRNGVLGVSLSHGGLTIIFR